MRKRIIIAMIAVLAAGCANTEKTAVTTLKKEGLKAKVEVTKKNEAAPRPDKPSKMDNYIFKERIEHKTNEDYIIVNGEKKIRIILKVRANDIFGAELVYNDGAGKNVKMRSIGATGMAEYFAADIEIKKQEIEYHFELNDGVYTYFYGKTGADSKGGMAPFKYTFDKKFLPDTPKWSKEVVWYQIFTDRFKNGNTENDPIYNEFGPQSFTKPQGTLKSGTLKASLINEEQWNSRKGEEPFGEFSNNRWKSDWNEMADWEKIYKKSLGEKDWYTGHMRHYGGDIKGVVEKLDYLKDIGITAIWFNPVFYAESNHKYDAADFRHIDPSFGVIEQTGENYGVTPSAENQYGAKAFSEKGKSEYKLLSYDITTGKNGLGETSDPKTWVWTESDLIGVEMIKEAHKRGIRVIFDGVFNHTGNEFWAFTQTLIEGPVSRYQKWYKFSDWRKTNDYSESNVDVWNPGVIYAGDAKYGVYEKDGKKYRGKWVATPADATPDDKWEIYLWNKEKVEYESWWGFRSLPKLDHHTEEVGQYMIDISKKWMLGPDGAVSADWKNDDGIDGWRLDVPLDIENQTFWTKWKKEIRSVKPDVYTSAEIWDTARSHVYGEKFDAVMNYEFAKTVLKFVVNTGKKDKIKASEFAAEANLLFKGYADESAASMQNLMDSHDTDRVFSMIVNPNREYNTGARLNESKSYKDIRPDLIMTDAVAKLKIITLMQMTYTGAPMIYYGDEAGIWGAADPHDRKPMMWQEDMPFDNATDTLDKYKSIIAAGKMGSEAVVDESKGIIKYPPKINAEIMDWYKKVIAIRNNDKELYASPYLEYILTDDTDDIIAYERKLDSRSSITVINNGDKKVQKEIKVTGSGDYTDLITGIEYKPVGEVITVSIEPKSGMVLYRK